MLLCVAASERGTTTNAHWSPRTSLITICCAPHRANEGNRLMSFNVPIITTTLATLKFKSGSPSTDASSALYLYILMTFARRSMCKMILHTTNAVVTVERDADELRAGCAGQLAATTDAPKRPAGKTAFCCNRIFFFLLLAFFHTHIFAGSQQ